MTHDRDTLIIGAGPAGLAAALGLGDRATLLERATTVGGLSRSIEFQGATFDLGGHSFHTPHPAVRDLVFDSLEMYEQTRDARCFAYGSMIPYPFQKHFRELADERVVRECAAGLDLADASPGAANFEEFICRRFGPGIGEHFMLPYNRKLWAGDLTRMAADWTAERVAAPEGKEEKFDTSGGKRKPLQSTTSVAYPAKGGFGEIYKALARRVSDLRLGVSLARVRVADRVVVTDTGEELPWQQLVSTLPLPELLDRLDEVPHELVRDAARLDYLSMKMTLVAIGHPVDTEIQRVYCAQPEIPAHKIAINHNSSDYLRAQPHHGIMCEISYSAYKPVPDEGLPERVVTSLVQLGLIGDPSEVLEVRIVDCKYAYPVPTHDRSAIVERVREWLAERGIYSVGRFAEWAYINSDECLSRGLSLGTRLRDA